MTLYEVTKNFFLKGDFQAIGDKIELTDDELMNCRSKVKVVVKKKIVIQNPITKETTKKVTKTKTSK